jgi:hypothetical protein
MSDKAVETKMDMDTVIPTGSWTLYYHSADEVKWTLTTFTSLGAMKTWREFWDTVDGLNADLLSDGAFFLMRDPIPPLWEHHNNIRGGCYSFRAQKKDAADLFITYSIACMLNRLTDNNNIISGLSISLKRGFNIIKVWNQNAVAFNSPSNLNNTISVIKDSDIIYTPFVQKKM